jgi:hypothetical protein
VTQRRQQLREIVIYDFPSFPVLAASAPLGFPDTTSGGLNSRKRQRGIRKEAPISNSCQVSLDKTSVDGENGDTSSIFRQTAQISPETSLQLGGFRGKIPRTILINEIKFEIIKSFIRYLFIYRIFVLN